MHYQSEHLSLNTHNVTFTLTIIIINIITTKKLFSIMASSDSIPVLTISLARHLVGHSITKVLEHQWDPAKVPTSTTSCFSNVGFDLDVNGANLEELRKVLAERQWSGIIVGWCTRGHVEFTELFESVVAICVDYIVERRQGNASAKEPKLIFCRCADDVVNATLRNFPLDD
ncbi:hypothetical protein NCS52_01289500 [Fusarium sp. LHS14.1]|nr:hypothetical protein NCS52_01289500 [Fusarium sp. LHS14.1]